MKDFNTRTAETVIDRFQMYMFICNNFVEWKKCSTAGNLPDFS